MVHSIESHLPALTRYAKSLCQGFKWLDHRDIVNEAVILCLNNNNFSLGYAIWACKIRAIDTFNYKHYYTPLDINDTGPSLMVWPEDDLGEAREEKEILLDWAEQVIAQRCPRGQNTPGRDKERRKQYLKEYRKRKKHEKAQMAA